MKYFFSFTFLFCTSIVASYGADVSQGAEALKNKEYAKAISIYQEALDEGNISGELHYNMGVAYAALDQLGYSIWHFELAKRAGLSTEDLYHNLRLVREDQIDEIEVIPAFFLASWWNSWKRILSSNLWSSLALFLIIGGVYGLYTWRTAGDRDHRKRGFTYGVPLILLAIVCFISAWSISNERMHPTQGVLLAKSIDLRSAPDAESAEILTVHEGVDVVVQDQIGEWFKVRLANGQIGWLPAVEVGLF